jgi:predicted Zn-dependent protease
MTRQYDKAQSHMDVLLKQSPKAHAAWFLQKALYMEQNKKLEALSAYVSLKPLIRAWPKSCASGIVREARSMNYRSKKFHGTGGHA